MSMLDKYLFISACASCYLLGLFAGKGIRNWKAAVVALAGGFLWPITVACGFWIKHWGPKDGD